jgi:hypothetical protein
MSQLIKDLPALESYDANTTLLLIQHESDIYKIKTSLFLNTLKIQSEYINAQHASVTVQPSTLSFSRQHILDINSSFIATFDFSEKAKLPSATLIKNAGDNFCKLLTFEGIQDLVIGQTSDPINLSVYTTQDARETYIEGSITLTESLDDLINISGLKLISSSAFPSISLAYCCAKIKGLAVNSD